ncbi:ABC transporter ATP-binding protein [Desulfomonile tiedjei]|uniref:ABC-type multidrug transport system, ATPase component n=1 Tax=Desulfomonile tiedjei (strain ATCC 49306 / DSM 6799 / DCB-1) TaxID=706587 RepID=I4C1E6_DESTA|nr:ABC transporter ATP-binding protein [Desulfomonile tiedjei]AFM23387.1 ABC-type multidrug transport system, ATPase component [Desulfomonile tiedjei DSM 6799]
MITLRNLQKRFGPVKALDGLEFDCDAGEIVALVGPNGSGKSTALRILAGIMGASGGEARIGSDKIDMSSVRLRNRLSYLPQRIEFPRQITAKEVLTFFAGIRQISAERVAQSISRFGFHGFEKKKVGELSGGMLQRLALAVVFLPCADAYVLDEPTNNLDAEGLARFREQTTEAAGRGASVIMSTHILREVEHLAHRIVVMANGKNLFTKRIEQFSSDLSQSRKMWLTIDNLSEAHRSIALQSGAEKVVMNCNTITVECGQTLRIPILNSLFQAGAAIRQFGLCEPSLEDMYKQVLESEKMDSHDQGSSLQRLSSC